MSLRNLILLFQEEKNEKNRNNIFKEILNKFAKKINIMSEKYSCAYGIDILDLKQEATITLYDCLRNYDSSTGYAFNTYFTRSLFNKFSSILKTYFEVVNHEVQPFNEECLGSCEEDKNIIYFESKENYEWLTKRLKPKYKDTMDGEILWGETNGEQAARNGCTHQNITRRQVDSIEKIQRRAEKFDYEW